MSSILLVSLNMNRWDSLDSGPTIQSWRINKMRIITKLVKLHIENLLQSDGSPIKFKEQPHENFKKTT